MKVTWTRICAGIATLAVAGTVVAGVGIIDIRASTGHWRVTDWFLHWVMRSSVRTAALGEEAPSFTAAMLPLAAGHYESGCAGCHGSPAMQRPAAAEGMLPPPPDLKPVIATWSDAQLFEIVRHGVRYTGMPAWPVPDRDDEVWAMVAFLRAYPGLDQATYQRLSGFSASQSRNLSEIIESCEGCHSPARLDETSLIPCLSGQSEKYLRDSLEAYATGRRPSGVMAAAITRLSPEDRRQLAKYFARQDRLADASPACQIPSDSRAATDGRTLAERGDPERGVAACFGCHDIPGVNPAYPRLAGQARGYLENQLRLFQAGTRGGGDFSEVMTRAAQNLNDDDIRALAAYYASMPKD